MVEFYQYKCGDCNKKFNSISELETHVDETRYECVRCKVSFTEIWELKIHQLRHNVNQWFEESNQNNDEAEMTEVPNNVDTIIVKIEKEENYPNTDVNNGTNGQTSSTGEHIRFNILSYSKYFFCILFFGTTQISKIIYKFSKYFLLKNFENFMIFK